MAKETHTQVLIIGAGIAGLSAASYLLRNGYSVMVVEQHTQPGGLCTSWKRNGYTVDYCVHWLMGTHEDSEFHQIWDELGAFVNADGSSVPIVNFDDFTTMELSTGEQVCLYSDREQLQKELLRIAPEDAREIGRFCHSLKKLADLPMTALTEQKSLRQVVRNAIKHIPSYLTMMQHITPMQSYAERFTSVHLRELFLSEIPPDWSLVALSLGLAQQHKKQAGYPVGGSLNLAKNIERVVKELGGNILYRCEVSEILVTDGVATGVRLADDRMISADRVISAADGHTTIYRMLSGKYVSKPLQCAYETYPLFPSSVMVALGVDRNCSDLPHGCSLYLDDPIIFFDGTHHNRIGVNVYHYDPTLAPKGKTLITVLFNTWEGSKWEELYEQDSQRYHEEKDRIAGEVINTLEKRFGEIAQHIEMVDVSTPHTVISYTGNWQGSYEGFAPTKQTLTRQLPKTLPALARCYLIGQWTSPGGGLPTAAKDGRDIAIRICREDGRLFQGARSG
jgi:phytoene dehydrogenase-like protein